MAGADVDAVDNLVDRTRFIVSGQILVLQALSFRQRPAFVGGAQARAAASTSATV
jgi:hypothetical protein